MISSVNISLSLQLQWLASHDFIGQYFTVLTASVTCFPWFHRSIFHWPYCFNDLLPMISSVNISLSLRLQWLASHDFIGQYFTVLTASVTCFPWFHLSILHCPYGFSDLLPMISSVNISLSLLLQWLASHDFIGQYFTVLTASVTCFPWFHRSIFHCPYGFSDLLPMISSVNISLSLGLQWLASHDFISQYFTVLTASVTCFPWFHRPIFHCPYGFSDTFPMILSVNILLSSQFQCLDSQDLSGQYSTGLCGFSDLLPMIWSVNILLSLLCLSSYLQLMIQTSELVSSLSFSFACRQILSRYRYYPIPIQGIEMTHSKRYSKSILASSIWEKSNNNITKYHHAKHKIPVY